MQIMYDKLKKCRCFAGGLSSHKKPGRSRHWIPERIPQCGLGCLCNRFIFRPGLPGRLVFRNENNAPGYGCTYTAPTSMMLYIKILFFSLSQIHRKGRPFGLPFLFITPLFKIPQCGILPISVSHKGTSFASQRGGRYQLTAYYLRSRPPPSEVENILFRVIHENALYLSKAIRCSILKLWIIGQRFDPA